MLLLIILFAVFIIVGGTVNYICSFKNRLIVKYSNYLGLYFGFFADYLVMIAISTVMIKNPHLVFVNFNWGWILAMSITLVVLSILSMGLVGRRELIFPLTQFILAVSALILLIFGYCFADNRTYVFKTAKDFNLLTNLPESQYNIELANDIDFTDYPLEKGFGGKGKNTFYINGNGYKIQNMTFTAELTEENTAFIKMYGEVENLIIDNCTFNFTPNRYEKQSGLKCDFQLFGTRYGRELSNIKGLVVTRTNVYITPTEENILYADPSTFGEFLPENKVDDENGNNINVTVTVKEN